MQVQTPVPLYFGPAEHALFGIYHSAKPTMWRGAGVLLCNPIGDDYIRAHRSMRHLAECLSEAGFAVLRFDFHGTGDSAGCESEPGRLGQWLADISLAIEELRARSGAGRISIAGLRLGATLAMVAASGREDIDGLILWNPYLTGKEYVGETTRQHKMQTMLDPVGLSLRESAEKMGGREALGFFLSDANIAELNAVDLLSTGRRPAPRVLVISPQGTPREQSLMRHLEELGTHVDSRCRSHKFLSMIPHQSSLPLDEIQDISSWLLEDMPLAAPGEESPESHRETPGAPLRAAAGVVERAVYYDEKNKLFGILVSPAGGSDQSQRPAIILLNAGVVHRIGPHRYSVRMAREWARLGFDVFRIDISGIGDSPAETGTTANVCYPRRGLRDVSTAMDYLAKQHGAGRFIVAGLCSGGDFAFQVALRDPRVVSTIIMNPRTFCVHDLEKVEMYDRAQYFQSSLLGKRNWLKLLRGEVDLVRHAKTLVSNLLELAARKYEEAREKIASFINEGFGREGGAEAGDVPSCLRSLAERGVDTFLLVSEHDPGVDYLDVHHGRPMKALEQVRGFRRQNFSGTDHTFTSIYAQRLVLESLSGHLTERYLNI